MKYFAILALADDRNWKIIPSDDKAYNVVSALSKAMKLNLHQNLPKGVFEYDTFKRLIVKVVADKSCQSKIPNMASISARDKDTIICTMIAEGNNKATGLQLMQLSMVISQDAHHLGGVLLHGALAEWNGNGVILSGPGGRGKTTASSRLPYHWHSFSDDMTLVVRDSKGEFWAHPWPTWSNFMFNGSGGSWDVQNAVPLKGIFFLEQYHKDESKPVGIARSICLLNESSEQAQFYFSTYKKMDLRSFRLLRFDNICVLAQISPTYILRLRQNGSFWNEIERSLSD